MPTAGRRPRRAGIVAASLAVHAVLLALVAIQAPRLKVPPAAPGLPEAIIPVLIIPRTPPPATAPPGSKPTPIRLHRRPQPFADRESPVAPLIAPAQEAAPAPKAPPLAGPRPMIGPTADDSLARNARNALRSRIDCNSPTLSRAEREACQDRFADRFRDAPLQGLGIDRDKATGWAADARRKAQTYDYKRSAGGPGTSGSGYNAGQEMRPGAPNMGMGSSSQDIGRTTGSDERRDLKVPF